MASQELQTIISINARMGSGFAQVGATLQELGSLVNGTSQQIINFGKESVEVYRQYELSMRDAEVALSTIYGRNTQELKSVMTMLNASATEWAATTIFHTDDVANAISEAAHAGWSYEQIMQGLPAAMRLAQAGNLDLSESVNYIVKSTYAAGIGFEDLTHFIDLWTYASNSSASTIGEFGDAMLRMGSTMRFVANPEELMTLIAVTANAGSTGSAAGTMIRNSMLRLIAPTDKANKAMQQLGATTDEMMEVLGDAQLEEANAILAAHGFSAFDENGEMKNVLDIYREMYVALGDVAGGFDNIEKNQDALRILSSIFPTRTITEALTLLRGAANDYEGLYAAMMGGDAENYGQYASETMMDTLNGKIEIFLSKAERLKQVVGDQLSDPLGEVLGDLGGIVDNLAEMDEGQMNAWIGALEVVGAAGPGLIAVGSALRLISFLFGKTGGIGIGLIAIAAGLKYMTELQKADLVGTFGEMNLEMENLLAYVDGLSEGFDNAYASANEFGAAFSQSVDNYISASGSFGSTLFSKMITHAKLTEADMTNLENLGNEMFWAVEDAVFNSFSESAEFWTAFLGGDEEALNNPMYQDIIGLLSGAYDDMTEEVQGISKGLRAALTSAFADGEISEEEYNNILAYMRSYNEALARADAQAADEEARIREQKMLRRAQTASYEDVLTLSEEARNERATRRQALEEQFDDQLARLEVRGATAEEIENLEARKTEALAAFDDETVGFLGQLWRSNLNNNGLMEDNQNLLNIAQLLRTGAIDQHEALFQAQELLGYSTYSGDGFLWDNNSPRANLAKTWGTWLYEAGGEDAVRDIITRYRQQGRTGEADNLEDMLLAAQIANGFYSPTRVDKGEGILNAIDSFFFGNYKTSAGADDYGIWRGLNMEETAGLQQGGMTAAQARENISILGDSMESIYGLMTQVGEYVRGNPEVSQERLSQMNNNLMQHSQDAWDGIFQGLAETYDLDAVVQDLGPQYAGSSLSNLFAVWALLYSGRDAEKYRYLDFEPAYQELATPIDLTPRQYGEGALDPLYQLREQGVTVDVGADGTELTATIDAEDGRTLTAYLNGDATDLEYSILAQDGTELTAKVDGDTSQLQADIAEFDGQVVTVHVRSSMLFPGAASGGSESSLGAILDEYAEGGRATEASIFGEGNTPEWAIPEAHSDRTAELLNAARAASGFTWPELLARFGGLNANPDNQPISVVYSPTINATDASGVERVLKDDKQRFERWFEDRRMRESAEVLA